MKRKDDDEQKGERGDELRVLADSLMRKPKRGSSVDEMSLESRRRAIAYGRARGNV